MTDHRNSSADSAALPSTEEQLADYVYSIQNYTDAKEVAAHLWPGLNAAQSVQVTPIAWTNKMQLSFLKDPAYAAIPMAMWGKRGSYADIALYPASQPSPAATVETATSSDGGGESRPASTEPQASALRRPQGLIGEAGVAPSPSDSHPSSSAGNESAAPEGQLAGRDCPGVLESDPALFNILNNALGTMHYHRLMSALNWNGYVITRERRQSADSERRYSRDELEDILANRWPSVFCEEGMVGTPNQFAKNLVSFFGSHPRAQPQGARK